MSATTGARESGDQDRVGAALLFKEVFSTSISQVEEYEI